MQKNNSGDLKSRSPLFMLGNISAKTKAHLLDTIVARRLMMVSLLLIALGNT
jgi:hypothetical protein